MSTTGAEGAAESSKPRVVGRAHLQQGLKVQQKAAANHACVKETVKVEIG